MFACADGFELMKPNELLFGGTPGPTYMVDQIGWKWLSMILPLPTLASHDR